jgi:hypothetical protein
MDTERYAYNLDAYKEGCSLYMPKTDKRSSMRVPVCPLVALGVLVGELDCLAMRSMQGSDHSTHQLYVATLATS